ncbi:thiol reductant ABC exporter subunit CydD [Nocardia sp. SYP-A9097]|uniref:thiol reductant ABC exporter subunit CydD n=1 Tax=Nocardia sp. SYP-A9097 TaxID=2663237 RepID=UPI00129A3985|nr:thiol reductant ABC exporter subunit CydD [Nocardia sp. SYP-A9097]MRH92501.1 thiol reductant ABC exporter subunit CydD [Nocardia sp. SYP-A9097]
MARPVDPRLWRHARSARTYLALSVGLSLTTTLCIVVAALALARVLAGVITDPARRDIGSWTTELVVFAAAVLIRVTATWWQSRLAHRAGAEVVAELETAVLTAGAHLPPRELESRRTELAVVIGNGLSGLRAYLAGYLPALLLSTLVPPIVLAVIAVHDWISGVIILVTLPLIPSFMILIGLLTQGRANETLAATTRLSDQLLDLFAGMPTLRALGRETAGTTAELDQTAAGQPARTMQHRVRELGDSLHKRTMSALRMAFLSSMVLEMLATLCVALVAVSIGLRLVFGDMGLYAGVLALILAPEVYLPLRAVGERFHAAQDGMAAAEKAFAVLDPNTAPTPPRQVPATAPQADPQRPEPVVSTDREFHGRIEIRDLTVAARDGAAPDNLSAILRPGAVTVLTGPNGSGKSTALQAILGLITPDAGAVTVDGTPVPALAPEQWWSHVAWLPQRPVLVPGTLRDNLELLGPPADDTQLDEACRATGFDTVLAELPAGWKTMVGASGTGLSLGQRQRLALTRTLAADRRILLLDEPTAHLDSEAEDRVLAALVARAHAGSTVVIVGHRPSILAIADHMVPVQATASGGEEPHSGVRRVAPPVSATVGPRPAATTKDAAGRELSLIPRAAAKSTGTDSTVERRVTSERRSDTEVGVR